MSGMAGQSSRTGSAGLFPVDEEAWAQHDADRAWLEAHRTELYEQYPKYSIAVYKGQVIAASLDQKTMINEAYRAAKEHIGYVVVDYLRGPDEVFVL